MEVIKLEFNPDTAEPRECRCIVNETEHRTVLLWVTIPIEVACFLVLAFGFVNLFRFQRAK